MSGLAADPYNSSAQKSSPYVEIWRLTAVGKKWRWIAIFGAFGSVGQSLFNVQNGRRDGVTPCAGVTQ